MLRAAPLLLLLLLLRCPEAGRASAPRPGPSLAAAAASPAPPAAPLHVRFRAHTFRHLLLWAPGRGGASSPGLLYDVQYKRYGNHSWTPAAPCTAIARRSCDLTAETARPSGRYFARVRAVAPDGTSGWTATGPFSPKEATLQLWNMSLSLSGNTLRVTLGLPVHRGKNSTLAYEDLHPSGGWSKYRVYVRRVSDNTEQVLVESNRTFELPLLSWGERYCLSVEPHLPSRPNPAKRTEEQCISTPPPKGGAWATAILSSALLSVVALGTLAAAWVRARVKKPMETPSVLKSFRKQTSPWLRSEPWTLGMSGGDPCSEAESIHPVISLGLKAHPHPVRSSHSGRAACRVPEQVTCWTPEAVPGSKAGSPRLRDRTEGSGCSTDSGICLQDPPGSHSILPPTGPRGRGGQSTGSSKEGRGLELEEEGLPLAPPAREAPPVGLDTGEALTQAVPPHARISGCQRQAGGPGEALGSSGCPPGPEGVARPVLASGYLKQASVTVLSAPGAPGADTLEASWGLPIGSARQGRRLSLSSLAPGGLESLPCLPESPKALLASGFLGQEPAWPPPHLSLLCASAHLSLSLPWCRV